MGKYLKEELVKGIRSGFTYTAKAKDIDRTTPDNNVRCLNQLNKNRTYYLKWNGSGTSVG